MSGTANLTLFEATVKPHRSLSRKAMVLTAAFMLSCSLAVTSMMVLLGAWPVIGFNGADLILASMLFWLNIRAARAVETITLNETTLAISRTDANGHHFSQSLPPYWLNVTLQERAGTVPKLILSARGSQTEIARHLGEAEKRDLAAALTRAIHNCRNPKFENPQLQ